MKYFVETKGGPLGTAAWHGLGKLIGRLMLTPLIAILSAPLAAAPPVDAKQIVTTVCAACHTETGNSIPPPFPRLSGLNADYLAKQLRDVASGERKSEIMTPIISKLKRNEILALANYFSRQTRTPGIISNPRLVAAGQVVFEQGNKENGVPACAGCHTKNGAGVPPRFPMLASQNADYVALQLQNFRVGLRSNDVGMVMRTTVRRLTDEEIQAVSQYVASLPVPPVPAPTPAAR